MPMHSGNRIVERTLTTILYTNEAVRLFKVLNRPSQPDPIGDKLAFHDIV